MSTCVDNDCVDLLIRCHLKSLVIEVKNQLMTIPRFISVAKKKKEKENIIDTVTNTTMYPNKYVPGNTNFEYH